MLAKVGKNFVVSSVLFLLLDFLAKKSVTYVNLMLLRCVAKEEKRHLFGILSRTRLQL